MSESLPSETDQPLDPIGMALVVGGAVALVIAMFLPAVSPPAEFPTVVDNQLIQNDGWPFGAFGLLAGGMLLAIYRTGFTRRRRIAIITFGALAAAYAVLALTSEEWRTLGYAGPTDSMSLQEVLEVTAATAVASPGAGVYAALLGGAAVTLGGAILLRKRRAVAVPSDGV